MVILLIARKISCVLSVKPSSKVYVLTSQKQTKVSKNRDTDRYCKGMGTSLNFYEQMVNSVH